MASFRIIFLAIAIFGLLELARAGDDSPNADKCYVWKVGAHATRGGNNEPGKQEKNCNDDSYCYVAMKKPPEGRQNLHATKAQFEGDCIRNDDPIITSDIDLDFPGDKPSCTKNAPGMAAACVCNKNLCNQEVSV